MRLCARVGMWGCTAGESEVVGLGAHSTMFGLALVGVASFIFCSSPNPIPLFPKWTRLHHSLQHGLCALMPSSQMPNACSMVGCKLRAGDEVPTPHKCQIVQFPRIKKWNRKQLFPAASHGHETVNVTETMFAKWRRQAFAKAGLGLGRDKELNQLYVCLHHWPGGSFRGQKLVYGAVPKLELLHAAPTPTKSGQAPTLHRTRSDGPAARRSTRATEIVPPARMGYTSARGMVLSRGKKGVPSVRSTYSPCTTIRR
jgi:hypothetical protein